MSRLTMFSHCHRVYLNELLRRSEAIEVERGAVLRTGMASCGALLVVLSGRARLVCGDREVAVLGPGDPVGHGGSHTCRELDTVEALEPLVVLSIDLIGS